MIETRRLKNVIFLQKIVSYINKFYHRNFVALNLLKHGDFFRY